MTTHLIIPDTQVKPGHSTKYLSWIGKYIVEKKPDTVVCLGDFADMPSLSSYDVGKKSFEGRRYKADIQSAHQAMTHLLSPLWEYNLELRKLKKKQYTPRLVILYGNHEHRITRVIENDPKLDGTISLDDLHYGDFGWETVPFLEPIEIDGVCYSHYFVTGVMGRAVTSARALVTKKHMSCTMGHNQNWDIHRETKANGDPILGLFAGSCYLHNEDYLGPQGNNYDRGIWMKYEVNDGHYYPHFISLNFLKDKYNG